jgi:hypothetical protein
LAEAAMREEERDMMQRQLDALGYVVEREDHCPKCQAERVWYRTPRDQRVPLDKGTLGAHWLSCPCQYQEQ